MTPLDEGSVHRKDLHLQTHNTHKRQTPKHPAGLEPATPASEWLQTYALDCEVTGIYLWNPALHYSLHMRPPLTHIPSHMNLIP